MSSATIKSVRWQAREEEERNNRLKKTYLSGNYTYRSLGRIFKISGQRVSQIIRKGGGEK